MEKREIPVWFLSVSQCRNRGFGLEMQGRSDTASLLVSSLIICGGPRLNTWSDYFFLLVFASSGSREWSTWCLPPSLCGRHTAVSLSQAQSNNTWSCLCSCWMDIRANLNSIMLGCVVVSWSWNLLISCFPELLIYNTGFLSLQWRP